MTHRDRNTRAFADMHVWPDKWVTYPRLGIRLDSVTFARLTVHSCGAQQLLYQAILSLSEQIHVPIRPQVARGDKCRIMLKPSAQITTRMSSEATDIPMKFWMGQGHSLAVSCQSLMVEASKIGRSL